MKVLLSCGTCPVISLLLRMTWGRTKAHEHSSKISHLQSFFINPLWLLIIFQFSHFYLFNHYYFHYYYYYFIHLFILKFHPLNNSSKFCLLNLIPIFEISIFISIYLIIITLFIIYLFIFLNSKLSNNF